MTIGSVLASRGNIGAGLAVGGGGAAANILASVPWVAQWKFNGDGQDSIGANHLTNNNSATFTTGKLGGATGATQLVAASSQYWSVADNAALSMGDVDFTICQWVYLDTKPGVAIWLAKDDAASNREYHLLYLQSPDRFRFTVFGSVAGGDRTDLFANTFGAPTAGVWYCIFAWHDSVANTINISINNGGIDSTAHATGVYSGASVVHVGRYGDPSALFWNGKIDNVCIAKSAPGGGGVLSAAQRSAFYAAGVGTEQIT